jgi:tripartite-type tricarboxylate transporter receptor subunit TctC
MADISRRHLLFASLFGGAFAKVGLGTAAAQSYPARPVTIICPAAAGGGTDAIARIVASLLERDFGQPFNVVNRPGGGTVIGNTAVATAKPDGYTLGVVPVELAMMHHLGVTNISPSDFTPLALVNEDPPAIQVNAESPYKTIDDLVAAIKEKPAGTFKASGVGQGGIWHIALVGWLLALGLKAEQVRWVPSNGAAPALQELASNGVDIVTCSIPEARAMIDAGRVRSLAVMAPERNPAFPTVPTLKEVSGNDFTIGAWRGVVAPKDLPSAIIETLSASLKKAYGSKEYAEFMTGRGFGMRWADASGFASFMAESDEKMKEIITAAGLAKK